MISPACEYNIFTNIDLFVVPSGCDFIALLHTKRLLHTAIDCSRVVRTYAQPSNNLVLESYVRTHNHLITFIKRSGFQWEKASLLDALNFFSFLFAHSRTPACTNARTLNLFPWVHHSLGRREKDGALGASYVYISQVLEIFKDVTAINHHTISTEQIKKH
jgi:hypothetical protein